MERFASLRVLKIEPHNGVDENKHQEHPEQIHEWTCEQDGTALPEWQRAVLLRLFRGKKLLVAGNSARLSFLKPVFSWCAVHIVLVLAAGPPSGTAVIPKRVSPRVKPIEGPGKPIMNSLTRTPHARAAR